MCRTANSYRNFLYLVVLFLFADKHKLFAQLNIPLKVQNLLNYAEANQPKLAALCFQKAKETMNRSELVRQAAQSHEQFSNDSLREEAAASLSCLPTTIF